MVRVSGFSPAEPVQPQQRVDDRALDLADHDAGAERVLACATHAVFSPPALEKLDASVLERVVVCDTIPVDPLTRPSKIEVLSVAGILAQTIDNVFRDDSVSAIFKGENQLF